MITLFGRVWAEVPGTTRLIKICTITTTTPTATQNIIFSVVSAHPSLSHTHTKQQYNISVSYTMYTTHTAERQIHTPSFIHTWPLFHVCFPSVGCTCPSLAARDSAEPLMWNKYKKWDKNKRKELMVKIISIIYQVPVYVRYCLTDYPFVFLLVRTH